jgi:glycosyltransferase involved in cell wall biosynthesis
MSPTDEQIIRRTTPGVPTILSPNGVDVEYFQPNPALVRDRRTAIYMGDYKYFPNTDAVFYFIESILPLIRARQPDFRLVLLGKDPPPELVALGDDPGSGVTVAGLVPDTRPYLQRSAAFVCPLRSGSGTRFKLLESLACGCPVISTSIGCEGLDPVDGQHMLIRDTPQAFAEAVLHILDDPALGERIGQQGRQWVVEHHAWTHSAALLKQAYDKLIGHEDPTLRMNPQQREEFLRRLHQAIDARQDDKPES